VAACWAVHGVHHQPVELNFTTAMRHAWFSDLYSFPFYVPLVLAGVPTSHFFVATTLLSFHALITHTEQFDFPGLGVLVTPRSHRLHHARNPRYLDRNFGAMLCVWDRLFGTHAELDADEPAVYGTTHGYETHDGVRSQWVLWRDLLRLARQARTLGDRVRVFLSRPGWVPPGAVDRRPPPPPRSTDLPQATRAYVAIQFAVTVAFALVVLIQRDDHGAAAKVLFAAGILATLATLGGLLDDRPRAWRWEAIRVALVLLALAA
jgi:hypothetical protein